MQRQQQEKAKPFCKVCRDAGKTESIYTSHYVKSKEGIVTCPTLKNVICRYCHKNGHTISHCQALKSQNQQPQSQFNPQPKTIVSRDVFPALPSSKPSSQSHQVTKSGYADMLKKEPIAPPKRKQLPMPVMPITKKKNDAEEDDYEEEYFDEYQNNYHYEDVYEEEQEYQDPYEEEEEEDYDW